MGFDDLVDAVVRAVAGRPLLEADERRALLAQLAAHRRQHP